MPKNPFKLEANISLMFLCLALVLSDNSLAEDNESNDQNSDILAKRNLIMKEHEYLREKPMSDDLMKFIERHKRNKEHQMERKKRKRSDGLNEDEMYVMRDGKFISVRDFKKKRDDNNDGVNSFTVVPLVIPLKKKTESFGGDLNLKNREVPVESGLSVTGASVASTTQGEEGDQSSTGDTTEDQEVLHKILEDLEGLMQWKHEGNKKEGVLCNLNGSWISEAGGKRFDICYKNSTRQKFRIHVGDRTPPSDEGFLCDNNWRVFGEMPFEHSGIIIVLAVHAVDKHIATFIGECRVCEGSESVAGTWLVGRTSRDCKDQLATSKTFNDVWRKDEVHVLQKKHLAEIGLTPTP